MKNKSYNSSEAVRRKITTHAGGGYSQPRKPRIASCRSLFIIIVVIFFCFYFIFSNGYKIIDGLIVKNISTFSDRKNSEELRQIDNSKKLILTSSKLKDCKNL